MNKRISFILPSLNVSEYIDECLQSVMKQDVHDAEILCIDAGSTDGTMEKIESYAAKDSRIEVIASNVKSYAHQVNIGIDRAIGEYIAIVETDDYVTHQMYSKLVDATKKYSLDYAKAKWVYVYENKCGRYEECYIAPKQCLDFCGRTITPSEHISIFQYDGAIWSGIYRRGFLVENSIRLNETPGASYQDIGFLMQVYEKAGRAMYLDDIGYCYRYNRPGASVGSKDVLKYVLDEWNYLERLGMMTERVLSRMCVAVVCETNKLIPVADCNLESKYILPYLEIIKEKISLMEKNGILPRNDDYVNKVRDILDNYFVYADELKSQHDRREQIIRQLNDFLGDKRCIAFGGGAYGRRLFDLWGMDCGKIACYCDNSAEKLGKKIGPYSIVSVQEAFEQYRNCKVVIANKNSAEEIKGQLIGYGVLKSDIMCFDGRLLSTL